MRNLALLLLACAAPAGARESLGQFGRWGAFRDSGRCFAIAEPVSERRGGHPTAAFTSLPGTRPQFHATLSRAADPDQPLRLSVGGRDFSLAASAADLWARDAREDARIVAAARSGGRLMISATDTRGRRFRDLYPLAGAASAIDAATIGCLRVR